MRPLRALVRWLFDWRTAVVVVSTALVALLAVAVVVSARSTQDALGANRSQRQANTLEVARLNTRISKLEDIARSDSDRISELLAEVTALQEQVRQLGGKPVVVNLTTPTTSGPATTTTTAPRSTSTTTPPKTTTTTTPCLVNVGRCIHSTRATH